MYCPSCGLENNDSTTYCIQCGITLVHARKSLSGAKKKAQKTVRAVSEKPSESVTMFGKNYILGGRYQILDELGRGGMGRVFKAIDKELEDEVVALKVLLPQFAADEKIMERFKRETRIARRITHPNVLRIYDLGQDGESIYISMELGGTPLNNILKAKKSMSIKLVIDIATQICNGLHAAHSEGIIHRDIKPQNILVDKNNNVKLADFGIARAGDMSGLTTAGLLMGTPNYMSPEQVNADIQTDQRSDIYSFGVVLFEMLTGRVPFKADTPIKTAFMHVQSKPPAPRSIKKSIPQWMENIVLKALEKDPAARFQNAQELINALHSKSVEIDVAAEDDKTIVRPARPRKKPVQKKEKPETPLLEPASKKEEPSSEADAADEVVKIEEKYVVPPEKPVLPEKEQVVSSWKPNADKKASLKKTGIIAGIAAMLIVMVIAFIFMLPESKEKVVEETIPKIIRYGSVEVSSSPANASIVLDEIFLDGNTPKKLEKIRFGVDHKIAILKEGFEPYQKEFILKDEDLISINAILIPLTGSLMIESEPSKADVYLDGKKTGLKTPYKLEAKPLGSKYRLTLKKNGYRNKKVNLEMTEKGDKTLRFKLSRRVVKSRPRPKNRPKIQPKPVIAYGTLRVNSIPWTEVYLNNKRIGKTPLSKSDIKIGKHQLMLVNYKFGIRKKLPLTIEKGKTFKKAFEFKSAITITSLPGTVVFIDGKSAGKVPIEKMEINVGMHKIKLTNEKEKKEKIINVRVLSKKVAVLNELFK